MFDFKSHYLEYLSKFYLFKKIDAYNHHLDNAYADTLAFNKYNSKNYKNDKIKIV
jgi:hypothetical protein